MTRQEYNREASSQATCNWVEVRNKAAIAAMQALMSCKESMKRIAELSDCSKKSSAAIAAIAAVQQADALIEELKKGETL